MDTFLLFGLIGFSCLILGFIGYSTTTNKIIKDQEREIKELRHKNELLKMDNEYLKKSRDRFKAYFDSHKISSDPASVTFRVINPEGKKVLEDLFKLW